MKTYYWTDEEKNNLPSEFVASKNERYIVIEQVRAVLNGSLVGDLIMNADFIERDHYLNYAACFVNDQPNKDTAKYKINSRRNSFNLWFTHLNGEPLSDEEKQSFKFVARFLLIY